MGDTVPVAALLGALALAAPVPAADLSASGCDGRLELVIGGDLEARLLAPARQTCDGGPRPDGDGLRVAYRSHRQGQPGTILIILAIPGIQRGEVGPELPLNVTVVREGKGEFYGTRGPDRCRLELVAHEKDGEPDWWHLEGRGECAEPLQGIAHEGEIELSPFSFSARVSWEEPGEEVLGADP
jgi:hypothetical protein